MKMATVTMLVFAACGVLRAQTTNAVLATSCGPLNEIFQVRKAADPKAPIMTDRQAVIYFVQTQPRTCINDCSATVRVGLDGSWAGATRGNSFLSLAIPAGDHHVCSNWQKRIGKVEVKTQLTDFVAEPGKVYYFRTRVVNPTTETLPEFTLERINADEGKLLVASYAMSESKRSK